MRGSFRFVSLFAVSTAAICLTAATPLHSVQAATAQATRQTALAQAKFALQQLVKYYWQPDNSLFYNNYPYPQPGSNYWWEANAIDALAEAVPLHLHIGSSRYIRAIFNRITADGSPVTAYFDDENWMALGLLHAYQVTRYKPYLQNAELLFHDIYTFGWQKQGGVVWNRIGSTYRNTPANAPAALLGAKLYRITKNRIDLTWATRIYDWEWAHLVTANGTVYDGVQGRQTNKQAYTYNYGTVLGASLELYKATGNKLYLHRAELVAKRSTAVFTTHNSLLLTPAGQGDGGLFKGIYVRYLEKLVPYLPKGNIYSRLLMSNAQSVWQHDRTTNGLFGSNWRRSKPPGSSYVIDLSTELSAVFLFNQIPNLVSTPSR